MPLNFSAPKFWYKKNVISYLLWPFSFCYLCIILLRRFIYLKVLTPKRFPIPIIVVGNITVGGTGKTPLVIWLANFLRSQGFKPGIITRGYGRKGKGAGLVTPESKVEDVGDEALLLLRRTACPVVVCAKRVKAVEKLLATSDCNIILSDDGLQHYVLARDIEIAVVDAERKFGNGFCLPAGPLREPKAFLNKVDFVINGHGLVPENKAFSMQFVPDKVINIMEPWREKNISAMRGEEVHAVAGIGNPQKFFTLLLHYGLEVIPYIFPDHYAFQATDLLFTDEFVITTEKDAVKIENFAQDNFWYLTIEAKLEEGFGEQVLQKIKMLPAFVA